MRPLLILLFVAQSGFTQQLTERSFYDSSWNKTDSAKAAFFRTTYYADTSKKAATVKTWLRNGTPRSVINFSDVKENKRQGLELYYHPNGQLKSQCMYVDNNLDGEVMTWYPSGQLKRKDIFSKDSLVSGKCYGVKGNDTAHFDYEINASYIGGHQEMARFIGRHIKYPKEAIKNDIEGQVMIAFIVEKNNAVVDERVVSRTHPLINEEALRVFQQMKGNFMAARLDGEPARAYMKLPVLFKFK